jgi:hypothetical protein
MPGEGLAGPARMPVRRGTVRIAGHPSSAPNSGSGASSTGWLVTQRDSPPAVAGAWSLDVGWMTVYHRR